MSIRVLLIAALVVSASACSAPTDPPAPSHSAPAVETDSPNSPTAGASGISSEGARNGVLREMEGDAWWESMDGELQDAVLDGAAQICPAADVEITYGEVEGGSMDMTYTREMTMALGLVGIAGAASDVEGADESAERLIIAWVSRECPNHVMGVQTILDEYGDTILRGEPVE